MKSPKHLEEEPMHNAITDFTKEMKHILVSESDDSSRVELLPQFIDCAIEFKDETEPALKSDETEVALKGDETELALKSDESWKSDASVTTDCYSTVEEEICIGNDPVFGACHDKTDPLMICTGTKLKEETKSEFESVSEQNEDQEENDELLQEEHYSDCEPSYNVSLNTSNRKRKLVHKRKFNVYRYVGDIKNADLSTPEMAKRCLDMALGCVDNQKTKIRNLRKQNIKSNRRIHTLEQEIQMILSNEIINQSEGTLNEKRNLTQP